MRPSPAPTVRASAEPASSRVYAHLKAGILDRTYPGGSLVTEGEVAERTGVSRTPVREALLQLQAERLVQLFPKRGALVLAVSDVEARDVLEARELVERWAAPRAVEQRERLLPVLDAHLAAMVGARDDGDAPALVEADRAFHEAVVDAAGNAVLSRLYASLRDRQLCMGVASMDMGPARRDRAVREHTGLRDALAAGDGEAFARLSAEHVRGAGDVLRGSR
ncbi:GntR family transcriptional regulator [Pseudokineococcus marinus]|uniref:GntR family transcriptional regulator n=1 Tax=Pseudokineococcus marinus TaxID=351215 RepID=A0A849BPH6_9ACTN|nr:GntR family transcriptional regulator [Pseudokineococcus marinus]NNH22927.1 GntR family transcriptional regulator [Pseudokineococcus marinus]